ncbi:MAG TPA: PilZ domain-containing protein [Vicinamibacterales bacterium]|jgi:c-di-GMP-binding flagellar brake protein YcgR
MSGDQQQDIERRRQPRWDLNEQIGCRLEIRTRVRLVDISATGALLSADVTLPVGASGHLRAAIGPAFTPAVEVKRLAATAQRPALAMGTIFTNMDERSRRSLEEFLKKANT